MAARDAGRGVVVPGARWGAVALAAALLQAPAAARAAHPLSTDDAGTLGKGTVQLELVGELSRDRADGATEDAAEGAVAVGVGVLDGLDLVVGGGYGWWRVRQGGAAAGEVRGLGDLAVDLKWAVLELGPLALALKPGITLPTGDADRGLGTGRICWGATVVATGELGPVALHANAGYRRDDHARAEDREGSRADVLRLSAAAVARVAPPLQLAVDVGAETSADRASGTWPAYALAGAIWSLADRLDLAAGLKVGLTEPEAELAGRVGVTARF